MNWAPHVTVASIVERQGRFLLVEEAVDGRLVYNQPAGHLENGETLLQAAARETLEETAWEVQPVALVGIYQWRHPGNGETFMRFTFESLPVRHTQGSLDPDIRRALWLSRDELSALSAQLRSPMVLLGLDDYLSGRRYPLDVLRPPP